MLGVLARPEHSSARSPPGTSVPNPARPANRAASRCSTARSVARCTGCAHQIPIVPAERGAKHPRLRSLAAFERRPLTSARVDTSCTRRPKPVADPVVVRSRPTNLRFVRSLIGQRKVRADAGEEESDPQQTLVGHLYAVL